MSQFTFISRLRQCLAGLPEEEIDKAVEYYEDYFADAGENEEEIIARLGSPEDIAENIRKEVLGKQGKIKEESGAFTERGFETEKDREYYQEIDKFTQIAKSSNSYDSQKDHFKDNDSFKSRKKEHYYNDKRERRKNRKFIATLIAIFGVIWLCILGCICAMLLIFSKHGSDSHSVEHGFSSDIDEVLEMDAVEEAEETVTNDNSFSGTPEIVPDQDIKELDIDIANGHVVIETGDQFSAQVTKNPSNTKIKSNVKNGVWKLEEKGTGDNDLSLKNLKDLLKMTNKARIEITITVPREFEAEKINIEIDTGKLVSDAETIITKKADFEVAAGTIEIASLTVTEEADIEVGMGTVNIYSGYINKLDLECDMGKVDYVGSLKGKSKIECNMGSVEMKLEEDSSAYTFSWETGMGTVTIDENDHGGLSSNGIQGSGEIKIELEVNMGSIDISTGVSSD